MSLHLSIALISTGIADTKAQGYGEDRHTGASKYESKTFHLEDSGNADTITVTLTDTSDNVFSLFKTKSISANATTELLSAPLVAQESEVIKVTAATANRLHVVLSALEIKPRDVT